MTGAGRYCNARRRTRDTLQSRIAAIPDAILRMTDALAGVTVAQSRALKQALGLAIASNGNILTVNGGNGLMVELWGA